jgi:rhodanese-related sulfurtransferase
MKIKILIAVALLFGIVALIAGNPKSIEQNDALAQVKIEELLENKYRAIDEYELADMIISARANFRIIDLRLPEEYEKDALPYSENMSLEQISHSFFDNQERYILYSDSDLLAIQAMRALNNNGVLAVNILYGGLEQWNEVILNPELPIEPNENDIQLYNRRKEIAKSFGAVFEGDEQAVPVARPKLAAPAAVQQPTKSGGC